jgi:hypothetical protein
MKLSIGMVVLPVVFAAAALGAEVKLKASETLGVARTPAHITTGVPFAKGELKDVGTLSVTLDGKAIPAQFIQIVPWEDGSVRWVLMDVQAPVPAKGQTELVLRTVGANPAPPSPVKVQQTDQILTVTTGPLVATIARKRPNFIASVKANGKERITAGGKGLVIITEDDKEHIGDAPSEVVVEQAGPVRTIIRIRGKFSGLHKGLLSYTARLTFYAGSPRMKLHLWLENDGATGYFYPRREDGHWSKQSSKTIAWFPFKGMAVDLGLGFGDQPVFRCEDIDRRGQLRVRQTRLYSGSVAPRDRAVIKAFVYKILGGRQELKAGDRTNGVFRVEGDDETLTAVIRNFWQEYDKAIEGTPERLSLWFWPIGGRWPRHVMSRHHYVYISPSYKDLCEKALYWLPGGTHKGHEVLLDFSGAACDEVHAEVFEPLLALAPADYYARTEAAPGMFAAPDIRTPDRMTNLKLASWNRMALGAADPDWGNSLWRPRNYSYATGWMDYGDFEVMREGHIGLHYDWTYLTLLGTLRFASPLHARLARDMARHRIDILQQWSDHDLPHANALQFSGTIPYVHHPHLHHLKNVSPQNNWVSGVVLYYMLTGEPKALECAMRNGEGLRRVWRAGQHQRGAESAGWTIGNFMAMYRLTGDRSWLDEALSIFKKHIVPLWKSHGPFLHNPGQQFRGQTYMREDEAYCYVIAQLCELHHLTGNEEVLKLLEEGARRPFPQSYYAGFLYISDLYAYVGLKKGDAALLARGFELFSENFPLSRRPPVYRPGTRDWTKESAMMLRVGNVMQYSAWKMKEAPPVAAPAKP